MGRGQLFFAITVICISIVSSAGTSRPDTKITAPLFAWANQPYFTTAARASYQVYDGLTTVLQKLISSAVSPSSDGFMKDLLDKDAVQQQTPQLVLVVLGSQLRTSGLRTRATQEVLSPLQRLMNQAESSIGLPYIMHEAAELSSSQQRLLHDLTGQANTIVVGCDGAEGDVTTAIQQLGTEPGIIVACTKVDDNCAGSPQCLAEELQQVQQAHDAAAVHNKRQMTVYAAQADAAVLVERRRLMSSNADVGVCGQLCQTQVKWLEGILAAFILAIAAFSGMCCLYMLDTPTRFEKPKEGGRTD